MGSYLKIRTNRLKEICEDKRMNSQDVGLLMFIFSLRKKRIGLYELKEGRKESFEVINRILKRLESFGYLDKYSIIKECVYLITFDDIHYKIGKTKNISNRLHAYETSNHAKLKVIHTIPTKDIDNIESMLLKHFEDKKVKGEWFLLDSKDLKYIVNIH